MSKTSSEENALGLLAKTHAAKPSLPIIMFACSAELNEVIAATQMGAADVILKPFRKDDIDLAVSNASRKPASIADDDEEIKEIPLDENTSFVRSCKRMREIESQCTLVARADIPVLILGESGTGKEVAAMLIHKLSARSQRSFLKVNCAAMPADLLESELFGYEQGAFTGAVKSKPGKFEICNSGTILLGRDWRNAAVLQAKLLQVLQDGSFSRLGSRASVKVDVRVIAATNIDIKAAIAQKTFREDLYYRLNGFTLKMPPLRERIEEIPDSLASTSCARWPPSTSANPCPSPLPSCRLSASYSLAWQSSRIGEYDQALPRPRRRTGHHRRAESWPAHRAAGFQSEMARKTTAASSIWCET